MLRSLHLDSVHRSRGHLGVRLSHAGLEIQAILPQRFDVIACSPRSARSRRPAPARHPPLLLLGLTFVTSQNAEMKGLVPHVLLITVSAAKVTLPTGIVPGNHLGEVLIISLLVASGRFRQRGCLAAVGSPPSSNHSSWLIVPSYCASKIYKALKPKPRVLQTSRQLLRWTIPVLVDHGLSAHRQRFRASGVSLAEMRGCK